MTDLDRSKIMDTRGFRLIYLEGVIRKEKEVSWIEVRTRKDEYDGEDYIDILGGRKYQPPHWHKGLNIDLTEKFGFDRDSLISEDKYVRNRIGELVDESHAKFKFTDDIYRSAIHTLSDKREKTVRIDKVKLLSPSENPKQVFATTERELRKLRRKLRHHYTLIRAEADY